MCTNFLIIHITVFLVPLLCFAGTIKQNEQSGAGACWNCLLSKLFSFLIPIAANTKILGDLFYNNNHTYLHRLKLFKSGF